MNLFEIGFLVPF